MLDQEQRTQHYIQQLFAREDQVLRDIRIASADHGLPPIHILPEEGRVLQFLLRAVNARMVVEIGTLSGYSAVWIARALPEDGLLITIEQDENRADIAQQHFVAAGISNRVEICIASADAGLNQLAPRGPFDAVFIDADKEGYPAYLDWAVENLRPGGLVMGHNALMSGNIADDSFRKDHRVQGVAAFNQRLADDPRLLGILIPLGDGIGAALKLA